MLNLDFTFTSLQVWAGPLSGNRLVVALWNRCSEVATITASWEALGLESGVHVSVRDLWQVSWPSCMKLLKSVFLYDLIGSVSHARASIYLF